MAGRIAGVVLALALVLAGCGSGEAADAPLAAGDALTFEVVTSPDPLISGSAATFELAVTNDGAQPVAIRFDTTQRGDVRLLADDVDIYHWAELRAFSRETRDVAIAPGQRVTFPLEDDGLAVAPGEYELLATMTGFPKLRTIRRAVEVAPARTTVPSPPPLEEVSPSPEGNAYALLVDTVEHTVTELALPLGRQLEVEGADAYDAEAVVFRQELSDAVGRALFLNVLTTAQVVADTPDTPDALPAARVAAENAATHLSEVLGGLQAVDPSDRLRFERLLRERVGVLEDYALAVRGDDAAGRDQPRETLDQIDADLGLLVATTTEGAISSEAATAAFADHTAVVLDTVDAADEPAQVVERAHAAVEASAEQLVLPVAEAYVTFLDLEGFDTAAAELRELLAAELAEEIWLLALAVDAGVLRAEVDADVASVLDENADQLAMAVGLAATVPASEEQTFLERWTARDDALVALARAIVAGGDRSAALDRLDERNGEIAQFLDDATNGALAVDQVASWLASQRDELVRTMEALADPAN